MQFLNNIISKILSIKWDFKNITILIVFLIVLAGLGTTGAFYFTSLTPFCGSCHSMQAFHKDWETSNHANTHHNVQCVDCHIKHTTIGLLAAKIKGANELVMEFTHYTAPLEPKRDIVFYAELCLDCHNAIFNKTALAEEELVDDKVNLKLLGGLKMSHGEHWRLREEVCAECHTQTKEDGTTDKKVPFDTFNKMDCWVCHAKVVHNRLPEISVSYESNPEQWLSEGMKKADDRCSSCHRGEIHGDNLFVFPTPKYDPEHKYCQECHPGFEESVVNEYLLTKE